MIENEIIVYGRIGNQAGLGQAKRVEKHVQLEARMKNGSTIRARKTSFGSEDKYTLTVKSPKKDGISFSSRSEDTMDITPAFFAAFEKTADVKFVKSRYFFDMSRITLTEAGKDHELEIPEINFEVDVYTKQNGIVSEWCKIEVEVDQLQKFLQQNFPGNAKHNLVVRVDKLPISVQDPIIDDNTPERKAHIQEIFDQEFIHTLNQPK